MVSKLVLKFSSLSEILVCTIFVLALFIGGSNYNREWFLVGLQCLGVISICLTILTWPKDRVLLSRSIIWLPICILAFGAIQLLPLPVSIPLMPVDGPRAAAESAASLLGAKREVWMLSYIPEKTIQSMLWLVPSLAVFYGAVGLGRRVQLRLVSLYFGWILISLSFSALQMALGPAAQYRLHDHAHSGVIIGFFANRNHFAASMVAALPLLGGVLVWQTSRSSRYPASRIALFGIVALLIFIGVLMTLSRTGAILGLVGMAWAILVFMASRLGRTQLPLKKQMILGGLCVLLAGSLLAGGGGVYARLDVIDTDDRFAVWPTIWGAAVDALPFGTGLGTFDAVYRTVESVQNLDSRFLNEAHNDYLQLFLELGIFFPIALVWFVVHLSKVALVARREENPAVRALTFGALGAIVLILLHSIGDYPLRTQALAVFFALCCAIVSYRGDAGHSWVPRARTAALKRRGVG